MSLESVFIRSWISWRKSFFPSRERFKWFDIYCYFKYSLYSVKMCTVLLKDCVGVKPFLDNSTLWVFFVDSFSVFFLFIFNTIMHTSYFSWKTLCKCSFGRTVPSYWTVAIYTHTHNKKSVRPFKVILTEN